MRHGNSLVDQPDEPRDDFELPEIVEVECDLCGEKRTVNRESLDVDTIEKKYAYGWTTVPCGVCGSKKIQIER